MLQEKQKDWIAFINAINKPLNTHINERGVDIVGVLLSSFDWYDHSIELVCQEEREALF